MAYFYENHSELVKHVIYDSISSSDGVILVLKNKEYTDLKKIYTFLIDENKNTENKYKQIKKLYSLLHRVKYFNCSDCLNKCCSDCFFTHYSWDVDKNTKSFINIDKHFHNISWIVWLFKTWLRLYMCEQNKLSLEKKKKFIDIITYELSSIIQ